VALDQLLAKQDITEVLLLYCRATDRGDREGLLSCFHEDAMHRSDTTAGLYEGRSHDYVARIIEVGNQLDVCAHLVSNVLIKVEGDAAVSECRMLAHHRWIDATAQAEKHRIVEGRYLDRFERREGVWRIAYRVGVYDYIREFGLPVPTERVLGALKGKKPDDPIYKLLDQLKS